MPIPKYEKGQPEDKYISECMLAIGSEYDTQEQALAVCYKQMEMSEQLIKIPIEIIGDNEEKILEYLPEPTANEMEHDYIPRCIIVLYPDYYDETMATSLCADKYQRKTTVTNLKKLTDLKVAIKSVRNFI